MRQMTGDGRVGGKYLRVGINIALLTHFNFMRTFNYKSFSLRLNDSTMDSLKGLKKQLFLSYNLLLVLLLKDYYEKYGTESKTNKQIKPRSGDLLDL